MKTYRLEQTHGLLVLRVESRPQLSSTAGAELAEEYAIKLEKMITETTRGVVMELEQAPPAVGPRTTTALTTMFRVIASHRLPVSLHISHSATQRLQLSRILTDSECGTGRIFTSSERAYSWANSGRGRVSGVLRIEGEDDRFRREG